MAQCRQGQQGATDFGKSLNEYGHFNTEYLENCQGASGASPADLKILHLFRYFCKNFENRTMGTSDILV